MRCSLYLNGNRKVEHVDQTSKSATTPSADAVDSAKQRRAAIVVRTILIVVPAIVGFLVAFAILTAMGPFANTWEFVAWFLIALVISFVTVSYTHLTLPTILLV